MVTLGLDKTGSLARQQHGEDSQTPALLVPLRERARLAPLVLLPRTQVIPHRKDSQSLQEGLSHTVGALKPVVHTSTEMPFPPPQLFPTSDGSRPNTPNTTGEQS